MFNKIYPLKKSHIRKYSNIVLFKKRNDDEYKTKSASTRKFNPIKLFYNKKLQHPQKITFNLKTLFSSISTNLVQSQKNQKYQISQTNTNLTQITTNTMITSILETLKSLPDSQLKKIKNINNNSLSKTENQKNILMLKKEFRYKSNSIKKNLKNIGSEKIKCKTYSNFNDCQLLYEINNNKKNNNTEKKKNEFTRKKLIFGKISRYHISNNSEIYNSKKQIEKTRDFVLMKYSANIKKERIVRSKEANENNIEMLTDNIESLQKAKKLYDIKFIDKLSEYVKFVFSRREYEGKQNILLRKEIVNLKKTNNHLNNKIFKLELEKLNLNRWLFLQIKIKEKKLQLPSYYEDIIEDNENHKIIKNKLFSRGNTLKKKAPKLYECDGKFQGKNNISKNYNIEISKEEYFRILQYKLNLIFKTPEELNERLKMFETENLKLIGIYNKLQEDLLILRNKYKEELINQEEYEYFQKNHIERKKKELNRIKKHKEYFEKIIIENKMRKRKLLEVKNKNNPEKIIKLNTNQLKLFTRIEKLYLDCKNIQFSGLNIKIDGRNFESSAHSSEDNVIKMMEFIELSAGHLLNLFNIYNNPKYENYEIMKKIKTQIDRQHKIEKAALFRAQLNNKVLKLQEEINKRNNKIIFRQRRKIDLYENAFNNKKNAFIFEDKKLYIPTFEDFMQEKKVEREEKTNKSTENSLHSRSKTQ